MPGRVVFTLLESVFKYDIGNCTWSVAPYMNQKRKLHSSCTVGNHIYVFFGFTDENKGLDTGKGNFQFYSDLQLSICSSIEVLNAEVCVEGLSDNQKW